MPASAMNTPSPDVTSGTAPVIGGCVEIATDQTDIALGEQFEPPASVGETWSGGASGATGLHRLYSYKKSSKTPPRWDQFIVLSDVSGTFLAQENLNLSGVPSGLLVGDPTGQVAANCNYGGVIGDDFFEINPGGPVGPDGPFIDTGEYCAANPDDLICQGIVNGPSPARIMGQLSRITFTTELVPEPLAGQLMVGLSSGVAAVIRDPINQVWATGGRKWIIIEKIRVDWYNHIFFPGEQVTVPTVSGNQTMTLTNPLRLRAAGNKFSDGFSAGFEIEDEL
jgi:hypothetical protein